MSALHPHRKPKPQKQHKPDAIENAFRAGWHACYDMHKLGGIKPLCAALAEYRKTLAPEEPK